MRQIEKIALRKLRCRKRKIADYADGLFVKQSVSKKPIKLEKKKIPHDTSLDTNIKVTIRAKEDDKYPRY